MESGVKKSGRNLILKMKFTKSANLYNPLVLAYIGDSLYDVFVRSRLIQRHHYLSVH